MQILHSVFQRDGNEFVTEIYRELLNRDLDMKTIHHYMGFLSSGASKIDVMKQMLQSNEAMAIYRKPLTWPIDRNKPTVANILYNLFRLGREDFIKGLYSHLLLRDPDPAGYNGHLSNLNRGVSRITIFISFLFSKESMELLLTPNKRVISEKVLLHILHTSGNK